MAGGGDHNSAQTNGGGHDQRAMEEGRKEAEYADHQGCAAMVVSVPFIQKVHNSHCEIDEICQNYLLLRLLRLFPRPARR